MLLVKKFIRRPTSVASLLSLASPSYAPPPGKGFYITDEQTKTSFLVDTGDCRSIHPANLLEKHIPRMSATLAPLLYPSFYTFHPSWVEAYRSRTHFPSRSSSFIHSFQGCRYSPCCSKRQHHCHLWEGDLSPCLLRTPWTFVLTDIRVPLLDTDFFAHYQLLVDAAHSCLIDISYYSSTPLQPSSMPKDIAVVTAFSK